MKKKYLCTLFDINYLPLGLTLYSSLIEHFGEFHLWILALDDECYKKLNELNLKNVSVIKLSEIEDKEVLIAKSNRTWQEYCWTLSPIIPTHVLNNNPEIDHIIYLDADLFFYSSPDPIFEEISNKSIMIIPHRFPDRLKHLEVNGIFNVQMMFFRRDEEGLACLKLWKSQCLEWCYYISEPDRMGDQKYLDKWPHLYKNILILQHIGAGVAMWNLEQYSLSIRNDKYYVNDLPLIFYHFHQFKYFSPGFYTNNFVVYNHSSTYLPVYQKYVQRMRQIEIKYKLICKKVSLQDIFFNKMTNPDFHHYLGAVDKIILIFSKMLSKIWSFGIVNKILRPLLKK
ncbi:putative nucleotide-diphospho-sugar transferase [Leptospira sp. GIMC2001]|uniref:putative nucleotide-diphospho-sugar transferase n=1 Tax=Leptospira sp. GIMC2001 TaxID=1513297 RepID=UPI0023496685|nr:putative nucleotide-diphospho-sugar transferase [Leptospira sp. GIMC2001]WCL51263.1 putative nucleotide-diphospho-sugar transferase [Leptospira sp. GIMC2001]